MKYKIGQALFLATFLFFSPFTSPKILHEATVVQATVDSEVSTQTLKENVRAYLESKKSPLALDIDLLLKQEHWKLLIAISAIESQYCLRQLGNNCWGITKPSGGYREYETFADGIVDANDLITRWQARGRWLTVEDMDGHYVVPANPNWVRVVNNVLNQLNSYERDR